jgi:tetratricopeptide (TPR) repeat protein
MAEALGLDELRARTLNTIGSARVLSGDRGGLADLEQSVTLAAQFNSPYTPPHYANLANTVIALGDLDRGFELQASGREAAERFGSTRNLRWFRAERSFQDYWQGHWEAALDGADQFLAETEAGSPHFMEGTCRLVRGLIRLARGELPGALADAASAVELADQMGDPEALLPALAFHARALLANGHLEQASAQADQLLVDLAERGMRATNPDWSGQLAVVLQPLGRGAELVALAGTVARPTPWLQAATAIARGHFNRAADIYAAIGSLPDKAYVHLRAAEQQLSTGRTAEAKAQLQQALAFYRQVAATGYLRQADELVATSA